MCPKEFCKAPRLVQALKNWGYHDSENIAAEVPSDDRKEQTPSVVDQNSADTNTPQEDDVLDPFEPLSFFSEQEPISLMD